MDVVQAVTGRETAEALKLAVRTAMYRAVLERVCKERGITVKHRVPHWSDPLRRTGRRVR